jgi:putative flippase GtrA
MLSRILGRFSPGTAGELSRFVRFLLVGGLNTVVGYSLFAGFILLGANSLAALTGATVLGILFNFASTGRLVFGGGNARLLPPFLAVYGAQFLLNWAALNMLERAGLSPLLAQLLLLPPLAVATFLMMRRFVFRAHSELTEVPDGRRRER